MLNSTGELEFSNEEDPEIISQLTSLPLSGGKSSAGVPEKTGYPDSVYVMAANIFQGIRIEKSAQKVLIKYGNEPLRSLSESEDQSFQRLSYELAFSALKYQDILETILIDSCIFPSTTIPDHLSSLIIVMLYDFQDRKFQTRVLSDNEEPISEVQEVENLLNSFKIKLAAALARCRIKHDALSIYHILPETVRKQELRASTLPLYAWINTCKISPEEVYNNLKRRGYNKVKSVLHIDDKVFAVDQHCYDVLIFPSHLKNDLINIDLFKDYKLIFQDKSRSLAVHSVKALLNMDDDVLMVNTGSWYTVSHMSILTNNNTSKVFVCGVQSQAKDPDLKTLFTKIGCKITKAQAVVYCTCSVFPEENEAVVKKALEFQDLGNKGQPYRLSPPVLPLCSLKEIQLSTDKFFRMEPSEITNGCFLSILTRERDPSETVSVNDVLARAAAKGLLDGIELGKSSKREKKKKKSKTSLTKGATTDNGIQMKIAEFLNRETKASANLSETVTKPPLPQKNTAQVGASSQTRKPNKLAPHPAVPAFVKNTCPSRPRERQTHFLRPRPEDRMVALKPIKIVLPPVFMPFSSPQGIRSRMPTQHLYCRWVAPKALVPTCLPTHSLSRKEEKPKDDTPSSLLRPPRRWL
ncbi:putative methyltransferase NSUN7 isoform X2 [Homo sapiens]|uniref:putative methyltransferase NSUN7 isoform X2 n=1 Tax=Homo sapiens TaxID=9606 RepID=UPI0007DC802F|nr:putative methyltransferase NSUN7 isoform X2 [Homo sapiens]|eukprot:XP_016864101.1 putative methyltransferase NSUN7 isoform X2 [Homo sapiens]